MADQEYDVVFVGGGLSALLLLKELRSALPERVAVIDPVPLSERPNVNWSYWSYEQTPYDRFAVGTWPQAEVARMPPQPIAPYTMRLVYSADVFAHLGALLREAYLQWLHTTARSIARRGDELYEIVTDAGTIRASWVFDSAPEVFPTYPSPQAPRALVSGTGIRVRADHAVFAVKIFENGGPSADVAFAFDRPRRGRRPARRARRAVARARPRRPPRRGARAGRGARAPRRGGRAAPPPPGLIAQGCVLSALEAHRRAPADHRCGSCRVLACRTPGSCRSSSPASAG
jgi:hypothetical protein